MASTLACIGLDVGDLDTLNGYLAAMPSQVVGRVGGIESVRYYDPSGARVVVALDTAGETIDLVPSYDARAGALLADLGPLGPVVQADVVNDDREVATRLAVDLEQRRHLVGAVGGPLRGSVVALGVEMTVHADADAFAGSDASVLSEPEPGEDPTRWAAESFVSYGLFTGDGDPEPTAFLAGTVLAAETHTHAVSGQVFHSARLRTVGFEATVCLPGSEHAAAPVPGNVVAGSCYLVVDVPTLWTVEPPRRKRRWGR
ncbi:hypothetical protein [Nocardioides sp.]|uniref:hypothetical protein n=1 Tax=Nocardioides sp. TaxID=35761 RepID=UPI00271B5F05|nr:hypothetical protein [Nocardioides sp.]MDO9457787.1 hypothetical protein [Nocardioides sp.]